MVFGGPQLDYQAQQGLISPPPQPSGGGQAGSTGVQGPYAGQIAPPASGPQLDYQAQTFVPPTVWQPAPVAGVSVGGAGGGAGGGFNPAGGGGVAPITAPATGPAASAPIAGPAEAHAHFDELTDLHAKELESALAAIQAEFGMTEAELMADQTLVGKQYQFLLSNLQRMRQQQMEAAEASHLGRGTFTSGLFGQEIARQEAQIGEQRQAAEAEKASKLAAINAALAALPALQAGQEAQTEAQIRREQLEAERAAAQA